MRLSGSRSLHSSRHLHTETPGDPLVHVIRNAHSRGHLTEVGDQTSVEAPDPLRPQDVAEQAEGVGLLLRQQELGAQPRLALQLGSYKSQGVGRQLTTAGTEQEHQTSEYVEA